MPEFIPVLTREEIEKLVAGVARSISDDYKDQELALIGVLKGAFIFLSDLCRHLTVPVTIDFVQASSYGANISSSGNIELIKDVGLDIRGKHVLIVEDIVDTGLTLSYLVRHIRSLGVKTVKICALIDKRERRKTDVCVDYACYVANAGFLVGYGLDYAENFRELPGIFHLQL
ncbi:hypoxanthine phosphoribosyltransferase [Desulfococcus sp.]|uniref:hypoxanthine phosphoribosyltransferase n=1 Tax=Desulfococcus sp. TaxID=2025834 RepID=UPI003593A1F2